MNLAAYILGPVFLLLVIRGVYKLIRCAKRRNDWPDDYPHGWE